MPLTLPLILKRLLQLNLFLSSLILGLLDDFIAKIHGHPLQNTNPNTRELEKKMTKLDPDPNERVNSNPNDNPHSIILMLP